MINLYCEYFSHPNPERKSEIEETLRHNIQFNFVDNFYVFCSLEDINECKKNLLSSTHSHIIPTNNRLTFQDTFNFCNQITATDDINITMNNDIKLTDTFNNLIIDKDYFYLLSKYENESDDYPVLFNYGWSHDMWIWMGRNRISYANFYYGVYGCDWKIANLASLVKYKLKNPALTYKTIHNHKSNIRSETHSSQKYITSHINFSVRATKL